MMKAFQRFLLVLGITAVLLGVVWLSPYGYLIKGVRLTYLIGEKSANYLDYKGFDTREIANDPAHVSPMAVAQDAEKVDLSPKLNDKPQPPNRAVSKTPLTQPTHIGGWTWVASG